MSVLKTIVRSARAVLRRTRTAPGRWGPPDEPISIPMRALDMLRESSHSGGRQPLADIFDAAVVAPMLRAHGDQTAADALVRELATAVRHSTGNGLTRLQAADVMRTLYVCAACSPEAIEAFDMIARRLAADLGTTRDPGNDMFVAFEALQTTGLLDRSDEQGIAVQFRRSIETLMNGGAESFTLLSFRDMRALAHLGYPQIATAALASREPGADVSELPDLALCRYTLGEVEAGDRTLVSFESAAHRTPAILRPHVSARYLEANRRRVLHFFDRIAPMLADYIDPADGRVRALLTRVRPGDRVLEVGCGKGRFLRAVQEVTERVDCTGVDLSHALMRAAPATVHRLVGTLESVPCRSGHFDVVCSVEAIEHSANWAAAVRELIRVTRRGGWVCIVDKQWAAWGRFECPPWERWPHAEDIVSLMRAECENVEAIPVAYEGNSPDGLMVAWVGQRL